MNPTLSSLKLQLTQLKQQHRTGSVPDAAFEDARVALERRIVDAVLGEAAQNANPPVADVTPAPAPAPATGGSLNLWAALVAVVLAIAGVAYWWKDAPRQIAAVSTDTSPLGAASAPGGVPHDTGPDQISAMVDRLALKLKDKPQDAEGWAMLARSYAVLGRHPEAVTAFERAMALRPNDATLMTGYADSLARTNKGPMVGAVPSANNPPAKSSVANGNATVGGTVTLTPALAKLASPEDTVFIFARAAQGEQVPLAVLRKQVKDLPLQFTLDDSMGMSPQNKLSGATQVVVGARISKSGQAMPQSGDISGQAAPVSVGTSGIAIEIRELVK